MAPVGALNLAGDTNDTACGDYTCHLFVTVIYFRRGNFKSFRLWAQNLSFSRQSIIYYMVTSPKVSSWIKNESLLKSLQPFAKWHYIERDLAMFNMNIDDDYVPCLQGITRASYCNVYLEWIQYCAQKRQEVGKGGGAGGVECKLRNKEPCKDHHFLILCVCESLSHVWLFVTPWTVACQAPLSMGSSRQKYWSG